MVSHPGYIPTSRPAFLGYILTHTTLTKTLFTLGFKMSLGSQVRHIVIYICVQHGSLRCPADHLGSDFITAYVTKTPSTSCSDDAFPCRGTRRGALAFTQQDSFLNVSQAAPLRSFTLVFGAVHVRSDASGRIWIQVQTGSTAEVAEDEEMN